MSPTEVMIEWSRGCNHIPVGAHPSECVRCTNSALQSIIRPMAVAAQAYRAGYAALTNKRTAPESLRRDMHMAGVILDDYLQKQVVGTLKPRPKDES